MARRPSGSIALARARDETALLRWAATVLIAAAMLLGLAAAAAPHRRRTVSPT